MTIQKRAVVKLVRGNAELRIDRNFRENETGIGVTQSFAPPAAMVQAQYASGTAANEQVVVVNRKARSRRWQFDLLVQGRDQAHTRALLEDLDTFLRSGSAAEPVYVYFHAHEKGQPDYEPLWGVFGAALRYEVLHVEDIRVSGYITRSRARVSVVLTIGPYAQGKKVRLAYATGHVEQVLYGGGRRGGTRLAYGVTNYFINPVFGAPTYDTGWTTEGSLTVARNGDPAHVLFGVNSVRLTATTANQRIKQSVTPPASSSGYMAFWVKRLDGGVVTTSNCVILIGASTDPSGNNVFEVGGGWYVIFREWSSGGSPSATDYKLEVKAGNVLFCSGAVFHPAPVDNQYPMMLYGEQVGCSWSGTPHESTSVSPAGKLWLPRTELAGLIAGTLRIVAKLPRQKSPSATREYFLASTAATFKLIHEHNIVKFTVGTAMASATLSPTLVGDFREVVIHATWDSSNVRVFVDGVGGSAVSAAGTVSHGNDLFIGSDTAGANISHSEFYEVAYYPQVMSADAVAADASSALNWLTAGNATGIPHIWLAGFVGSQQTQNALDSANNNYAVADGVPGAHEAITEFDIWTTTSTNRLYLSNWRQRGEFRNPNRILFFDQSGSGDGTASGGARRDTSVSTSMVAITASNPAIIRDRYRQIAGLEVVPVYRLNNAGSGLSIRAGYSPNSTIPDNVFYTDYTPVTAGEWTIVQSAAVVLPNEDALGLFSDQQKMDQFRVNAYAIRASGSGTVQLDYLLLMPRPLIRVDGFNYAGRLVLRGRDGALLVHNTGQLARPNIAAVGDEIHLMPGMVNVLINQVRFATGAGGTTIGAGLYYDRVDITPRFTLV